MMDLIRTISEAPSFRSCSAFRQNPTWLTCSLIVSETLPGPQPSRRSFGQEPRTGLEAAGNAGADHDAQGLLAVERGAVLRRRARRPFCKKAKSIPPGGQHQIRSPLSGHAQLRRRRMDSARISVDNYWPGRGSNTAIDPGAAR